MVTVLTARALIRTVTDAGGTTTTRGAAATMTQLASVPMSSAALAVAQLTTCKVADQAVVTPVWMARASIRMATDAGGIPPTLGAAAAGTRLPSAPTSSAALVAVATEKLAE